MADKETWRIGADCDKIEKLIKCNMHIQYHKSIFMKKRLSQVTKQLTVFFYEW